jgi:MFS superfamily sulfate permease-like transporter
VSAGVILVVLAARKITPRIPGPLIAVIIAIGVSRAADLASRGVAVVGPVPRGLPSLGLPALGWQDAAALLGAAASMFVVILAQSAATSRAYAVEGEGVQRRHRPGRLGRSQMSPRSGTFVVNGSPTRCRWSTARAGRSRWPSSTAAVVLIVLLLLTGPLAHLPADAALAAVSLPHCYRAHRCQGMRRILAARRHEFAVALLDGRGGGATRVSAASCSPSSPRSSTTCATAARRRAGEESPARAAACPGSARRPDRGRAGRHRFGASLSLPPTLPGSSTTSPLVGHGGPLRWIVLDCAAIGDINYTASAVLADHRVHQRHVRFVVTTVLGPVRKQLDRYGISAALGPNAYYDTPGEALEAFHAAEGVSGE